MTTSSVATVPDLWLMAIALLALLWAVVRLRRDL
jgi:hypothetical protein